MRLALALSVSVGFHADLAHARGPFAPLIDECIEGKLEASAMVETAVSTFGFTPGEVNHADIRMARSEDLAIFRFVRHERGVNYNPFEELVASYSSSMKRLSSSNSWSSRDDHSFTSLIHETGVSLIIWSYDDKPNTGCLFHTVAPYPALTVPEEIEPYHESISDTYGSAGHYALSKAGQGVFILIKPTDAFNRYAPFRPQTTSLLFINAFRPPDAK